MFALQIDENNSDFSTSKTCISSRGDTGAVTLYYNNTSVLSTTSSGVSITGDLSVDSGVLFVDASTNMVGINNTTPSYPLDVTGIGRFTLGRNPAFAVGGSSTEDEVFDTIKSSIPNLNDRIIVSGAIVSNDLLYIVSAAYRYSSTEIRFWSIIHGTSGGTSGYFPLNDGATNTINYSLAW